MPRPFGLLSRGEGVCGMDRDSEGPTVAAADLGPHGRVEAEQPRQSLKGLEVDVEVSHAEVGLRVGVPARSPRAPLPAPGHDSARSASRSAFRARIPLAPPAVPLDRLLAQGGRARLISAGRRPASINSSTRPRASRSSASVGRPLPIPYVPRSGDGRSQTHRRAPREVLPTLDRHLT